MEQSKYYQPDISEFRVGFEYEYLEHFGKDWGKWNEYEVKADDSLYHLSQLLVSCAIRVKYLDASDIGECGFKYVEFTENGVNFIKHIDNPKQSIHLTLFNTNHRVGIVVYNFNVEPPMIYEEVGTFGGTIKNKSELKQMFKVLGVIE